MVVVFDYMCSDEFLIHCQQRYSSTTTKRCALCTRSRLKKAVCSSLYEAHLGATERHLPFAITQCYLPSDTGASSPARFGTLELNFCSHICVSADFAYFQKDGIKKLNIAVY